MRFPLALLRLYGALAALPALAVGTLLVFYTAAFDGRIYPNVVVGGVDVGGLSLAEARAALRESASELLSRPLGAGERNGRPLTLSALGASLPPSAIERVTSAAHAVGRARLEDPVSLVRHQLLLWQHGEHLPVSLELDATRARAALDELATSLERPAANAHLELVLTEHGYEVHTLPAVVGERVDREATLARLQAWLDRGTVLGPYADRLALDVVVVSIPPEITDADVDALRAQIHATVGAPLVFRRADGESWSLEPPALATVVRLEGLNPVAYYTRPSGAPRPALVVDEARLAELVNAVLDAADRPAQEPALEALGDRVSVRAGQPGHLVDRAAALSATREALAAGAGGAGRTVQLHTSQQLPAGDPATLVPVADWLNERLALPLILEFQGSRRQISRTDLLRLLDLRADPPGLDRSALHAFLAGALPGWIRLDAAQGVVEPSLGLRNGRVEIIPGRAGQSLDVERLASEVAVRFTLADPSERITPVTTAPTPPRLSEGDLVPARDAAHLLISRPVRLYSPAGEWLLGEELLQDALRFERAAPAASPRAYLDRTRLAAALGSLGREAESKAGALGLRDSLGRAWSFDSLATADEVIEAAGAADAERYAPIRWRNES